MELMLGMGGTVEAIDSDGDVRVEMDGGGGSFLWNPMLLQPPSPFSPGDKVTIRAWSVSEAQAAQVGHGGWSRSMEMMLGKTGVVENVGEGARGGVRVKMDVSGDSKLWNPEMVLRGWVKPTASLSVGSRVTIRCLSEDEARAAAQDTDGREAAAAAAAAGCGWRPEMAQYLGKAGVVLHKYEDGDVRVKFDDGAESVWSYRLVLPALTTEPSPLRFHRVVRI
ncbi:hypothetical protein PLESTB_001285200 [Pleodorina starrii]|uniref:Mind bomb SH3 repeat domain-containing protein n=1 Tax=Pleodorina starrii TaxID=330485 RepID=A0A9W6F696_9CHLO|nr:hypothetical protein PLESTB_001285200 [Pleodorina starrii]